MVPMSEAQINLVHSILNDDYKIELENDFNSKNHLYSKPKIVDKKGTKNNIKTIALIQRNSNKECNRNTSKRRKEIYI